MVEDLGLIKKLLLASLIGAGYFLTIPGAAQFGAPCDILLPHFRSIGLAFATAFCGMYGQCFNNFFNASFW